MPYIQILLFTSLTVTILLAVFYWRSDFRRFFLLNASMDIIGFTSWYVFSETGQIAWVPVSFFILFSLDKEFFNKWKLWIFAIAVPIFLINFYINNIQQQYFVLAVCLFLTFRFVMLLIGYYSRLDKLNLFYILNIISQSLVLVSLISSLRDDLLGPSLYYAGIVAQTILGMILIAIHKSVPKLSDSRF